MRASRPNILWILTTQWRAQATGYAGDPNARTPHLDTLARQSINYAQAVTPHPFGPFARAAILTGMPSPENGIRDYFDPLPAGTPTIAHALRTRGYATAFFGKWHLGPREPTAPLVGDAHARIVVPPEARGGFEEWEGFEGGFRLNDPWLHGTRLPQPMQFAGYQSDVLCTRAAEWVARRSPWFCVVSLEPPHPPYAAPAAGVSPRRADELVLAPNVPRGGDAEVRARRELAGYYAHIEATDRAIGGLLTRIDDHTVIVVTSVHGDMHGAHGLFRKGWPHEESVRVPLLVRPAAHHPREIAGGVARLDPVSLLELKSWTLAWADGAEPPPHGAAAAADISMPSVVELPQQCDRVWRGVRARARKLVLNADGSPWLFFDLQRDPGENENLVDDRAFSDELRHWCTVIRSRTAADNLAL